VREGDRFHLLSV